MRTLPHLLGQLSELSEAQQFHLHRQLGVLLGETSDDGTLKHVGKPGLGQPRATSLHDEFHLRRSQAVGSLHGSGFLQVVEEEPKLIGAQAGYSICEVRERVGERGDEHLLEE